MLTLWFGYCANSPQSEDAYKHSICLSWWNLELFKFYLISDWSHRRQLYLRKLNFLDIFWFGSKDLLHVDFVRTLASLRHRKIIFKSLVSNRVGQPDHPQDDLASFDPIGLFGISLAKQHISIIERIRITSKNSRSSRRAYGSSKNLDFFSYLASTSD